MPHHMMMGILIPAPKRCRSPKISAALSGRWIAGEPLGARRGRREQVKFHIFAQAAFTYAYYAMMILPCTPLHLL